MSANVRLLPALMVTAGVLLGLKAIGVAEAAGEGALALPKFAADAAPEAAAAASAQTPPAAAAEAPPSCPGASFADQAGLSATEVEVLQSLGARRTALDAREAEMATQTELLAASEKRMSERLAELKRVQARVEELLGQVDEEQAKRIAGMVDVYQKMKPKDAAAIFEALDDDVMLSVAGRMKQANLAEVMNAMSPARARTLTTLLLRQKDVAKEALAAAAGAPG